MTVPDAIPATPAVFPWQPGYQSSVITTPAVEPADLALPTVASVTVPAADPVPSGSLSSALQDAVLKAAEGAALAALPSIEKQVLSVVLGSVGAAGVPSAADIPVPTVGPDEFTKAAARSRAFRTFFIGLGLAVLWGFVNALGSLSHADFFSRTGLISVCTLLVSSVVGSVVSYVARIKVQPGYVSSTPQPPPKG